MPPLFESHEASLVVPVYMQPHDLSLFANVVKKASFGRVGMIGESKNIAVQCLSKISIQVNKGDRIGLIGRNGAGKSSLLKLMAGIVFPTSGQCLLSGTRSSILEVGAGLDFELTGRQNVRFIANILSLPKSKHNNFELEIHEFCELEHFFDLPVRTYSTGMKARLAFAIATYEKSDLLLIDEFINTGDKFFVDKASNRIQNQIDGSGSLVLATHSVETLDAFCDYAFWIDGGRLIRSGPPLEVWHYYLNNLK